MYKISLPKKNVVFKIPIIILFKKNGSEFQLLKVSNISFQPTLSTAYFKYVSHSLCTLCDGTRGRWRWLLGCWQQPLAPGQAPGISLPVEATLEAAVARPAGVLDEGSVMRRMMLLQRVPAQPETLPESGHGVMLHK